MPRGRLKIFKIIPIENSPTFSVRKSAEAALAHMINHPDEAARYHQNDLYIILPENSEVIQGTKLRIENEPKP